MSRRDLLRAVDRVLATNPVCPQCFVNEAKDKETARRMLPHLTFLFCATHAAEMDAACASTEEPF